MTPTLDEIKARNAKIIKVMMIAVYGILTNIFLLVKHSFLQQDVEATKSWLRSRSILSSHEMTHHKVVENYLRALKSENSSK